MIPRQKSVFSSLLWILYLFFLGYGTLCLRDDRISPFHEENLFHSSSSHQHGESKGAKNLFHPCFIVQNLILTTLLTEPFLLVFVLIICYHVIKQVEKFYQVNHLSPACRSPPDFILTLIASF
jgi:hypothetical protein